MQDHITRTRLAGAPPHVMPRLRTLGLMAFNRADKALRERPAAYITRAEIVARLDEILAKRGA